jgi:hypothetical protein
MAWESGERTITLNGWSTRNDLGGSAPIWFGVYPVGHVQGVTDIYAESAGPIRSNALNNAPPYVTSNDAEPFFVEVLSGPSLTGNTRPIPGTWHSEYEYAVTLRFQYPAWWTPVAAFTGGGLWWWSGVRAPGRIARVAAIFDNLQDGLRVSEVDAPNAAPYPRLTPDSPGVNNSFLLRHRTLIADNTLTSPRGAIVEYGWIVQTTCPAAPSYDLAVAGGRTDGWNYVSTDAHLEIELPWLDGSYLIYAIAFDEEGFIYEGARARVLAPYVGAAIDADPQGGIVTAGDQIALQRIPLSGVWPSYANQTFAPRITPRLFEATRSDTAEEIIQGELSNGPNFENTWRMQPSLARDENATLWMLYQGVHLGPSIINNRPWQLLFSKNRGRHWQSFNSDGVVFFHGEHAGIARIGGRGNAGLIAWVIQDITDSFGNVIREFPRAVFRRRLGNGAFENLKNDGSLMILDLDTLTAFPEHRFHLLSAWPDSNARLWFTDGATLLYESRDYGESWRRLAPGVAAPHTPLNAPWAGTDYDAQLACFCYLPGGGVGTIAPRKNTEPLQLGFRACDGIFTAWDDVKPVGTLPAGSLHRAPALATQRVGGKWRLLASVGDGNLFASDDRGESWRAI